MSTSHSPDELVHQVVLLSKQGMKGRAIARALGVSRNTVKKILVTHADRRTTPVLALAAKPQRSRPTKLDAHHDQVKRLLSDYPEITAQRVLEELRERGFEGGYSQVKERVRQLRPAPAPKVSLPVEKTAPGEMAECDWSPYTIDFTDGSTKTVQAFGYA